MADDEGSKRAQLEAKFEALKEVMVLALDALFRAMPAARAEALKALSTYAAEEQGITRETVQIILDDLRSP